MGKVLLLLALIDIQQADIEAAQIMCQARFDVCRNTQCDMLTDIVQYTHCRVTCRKTFQSCIEQVTSMLDQG